MDREKKKKVAAALAAIACLHGSEETRQAPPSRWAKAGREQIMLDRSLVITRR